MGTTELTKDGEKRDTRKGGVPPGCCASAHTRRCCLASGVIGGFLVILGLLLLVGGKDYLREKILKSMALSPGSKRLATWLVPPVQAHLTGYGFHVTNPEEVMRGEKPIVKEVGPFVYKAVTIKDSVDQETGESHLVYGEDGETLTYRPRKFYYLDRAQSTGGDPDTTFLTVPNVPLLTAFSKIRDMNWITKPIAKALILKQGRGTPFINVSFSGLLWGYADEMPCMKMTKPEECPGFMSGILGGEDTGTTGTADKPDGEEDDDWTNEGDDDWTSDDDWSAHWGDEEDAGDEGDEDEWDFKRKKREVGDDRDSCRGARQKREVQEISLPNIDLRTANFSALFRPKAEFVDCKCQWGLFRDRNVTLRKPLKIHHGMGNLSMKGWVEEFDGKKTLDWWLPGSKCDEVGGQDTSTLPPGWRKDQSLDFYTSLMCRRIKLDYEQEEVHAGLTSFRYIPSIQQLASPNDPNDTIRNEENSCYCIDGFSCLKSGVFNMEPCKRTDDLPRGAPIALSYPHFYQADPSFREAVEGLTPNKDLHQFYIDVVPDFGFPLAIRPRFQLNAILRRDTDIEVMAGFAEELVLPFLWAQDGFSEPSDAMADAIKLGLKVPGLAVVGGGVLLCLGLGMVAMALLWGLWQRRLQQSFGPESLSMSRL